MIVNLYILINISRAPLVLIYMCRLNYFVIYKVFDRVKAKNVHRN